MELVRDALDIFFRLDVHLNEWAGMLGLWLYLVLFLIIFCETGLVVTPFLPGDSLLFAVGALASIEGSPLRFPVLGVLLFVAAVAGDAVNYAIGYRVGPQVFSREQSRLFKREHLLHTQRFYGKYGGKTIVLARFIPIVRTFAPAVAGAARMNYRRFVSYNVIGGILWVWSMVLLGYSLGSVIPNVGKYIEVIIIVVVLLSVLPAIVEAIRQRRASARASAET